jgi:hypothetical protein
MSLSLAQDVARNLATTLMVCGVTLFKAGTGFGVLPRDGQQSTVRPGQPGRIPIAQSAAKAPYRR